MFLASAAEMDQALFVPPLMIEMERSVAGINLHATFLDVLIITVRQEMDLLTAMSQLAAIVAANGSNSDDSVSHIESIFDFGVQN